MISMRRIVAACVVVAAVVAAQADVKPAPGDRYCRTHVDPVLRVKFPEYICGLRLESRRIFENGDDDYTLCYRSTEPAEGQKRGRRYLDIGVFTPDREPVSDGVNEKVQKQLENSILRIRMETGDGIFSASRITEMFMEGRLARSGLKFEWFPAVVKFQRHPEPYMMITAMFAWRDRYIRLQYHEKVADGNADPGEFLPPVFREIADAIDGLIAEAEAAAKVDVYAIADPAAALKALQKKWLGADTRVPQCEMPDYLEEFLRVDRVQDWCAENMKERRRAEIFASVTDDAVRMRIEPQIWHYNHACAMACLGEKEKAFESLEQAVAAGYHESSHAKKDPDLESIRGDPRFPKLMAMCGTIGSDWRKPKREAVVEDGTIKLDDGNVYWAFNNVSYSVHMKGVKNDTLIFLDRNMKKRMVPPNGTVTVRCSEEFERMGRSAGFVNFNFGDLEAGERLPVIAACSDVFAGSTRERFRSLAGWLWGACVDSDAAVKHLYMNVLGIYSAGNDYAHDGVDRIIGWCPATLTCHGKGSADGFADLCAEAWHAMKPEVRATGGVRQLHGILRRGQKVVKTPDDFMSGGAQRPSLSIKDVDRAKVLEIARKLEKPYPEMPVIVHAYLAFKETPVTDIRTVPYARSEVGRSLHHVTVTARWGERTGRLGLMVHRGEGELVWKTLQGDASKVRIVKKKTEETDGRKYDVMEIECDYHDAFDVKLADGTMMKSTRVDIGCFRMKDGAASLPAIVSFWYMPTETREYGEDGLLKSIDYTKPQIPGWLPEFCPRGDVKDVFRWTEDGELSGWTRTKPKGGQIEFTRDGFVVQTRDGLGRPLDVRRSMRMEWMQSLKPFVITGKTFVVSMSMKGGEYDADGRDPAETTLAWRYEYENDADRFGKPSPKPAKPFSYRPELCRRAEFAEDSEFRLPLLDQMMLGNEIYLKYKFGTEDGDFPSDAFRVDSRFALAEKGLVPPRVLKKMRFAPWTPSKNDLWKPDPADFEKKTAKALVELADGAYRLKMPSGDDSGKILSVRESYWLINWLGEATAYGQLDSVYRRCGEDEIKKVFAGKINDDEWKRVMCCTGHPVNPNDVPDGTGRIIGMWEVTPSMRFCIIAELEPGIAPRKYCFIKVDGETAATGGAMGTNSGGPLGERTLPEGANRGTVEREIIFSGLPSRAIGNTVLSAMNGDAAGMNNLAVLLYAEMANAMDYDEAQVIGLLREAERLGCPEAKSNLEVLRHNRGEAGEAR